MTLCWSPQWSWASIHYWVSRSCLTEDEELQTTGMPSLDDIVREIEGDANASDDGRDEEADQDLPVAPPHSEFLKCLEVVECYMSFNMDQMKRNIICIYCSYKLGPFANSQAKHRIYLISSLHQNNILNLFVHMFNFYCLYLFSIIYIDWKYIWKSYTVYYSNYPYSFT